MKNKVFYFIFSIFLFCTCTDKKKDKQSSLNNNLKSRSDSNFNKKNFDSLIVNIDTSIGTSLDYSEELLANPSFMEIYNHSNSYFGDALNFISKDSLSGWHPYVCILVMQNLPISEYMKFCNVYLNLFEKGKISEGILHVLIDPNFFKKRVIPKNFNNPEVIKFLNKVLDNGKVSNEFKVRIKTILSGEYIKNAESEYGK
jgi:hypothetical protein